MKLVVGLGNPGPRYENTRHNVGFRVLDRVAERLAVSFSREKHQALLAEGRLGSERIMLVKPQTFMNKSGVAVAQAARNKVRNGDDLLVVVDDADLPLGRIRFRPRGSAGGHNGLKSIIEHVGTRDFARLRMGIDRDAGPGDLVNHVLTRFRPEEMPEVDAMVARAVDGVLRFLEAGVAVAMNEFNASPGPGEA